MWVRRVAMGSALLLVGPALLTAQRQGDFLRPSPDQATTRVGNRGANFLEIGVGARAAAMAGAMTGLASGATAMYWNPAGIATTDGVNAAFSLAELFEDLGITHSFAGVVLPFANGGLGLSYIRLDSGDIPRTDEFAPAGDNPAFGETFDWTSQAMGLHYARRLTDRLQLGIGAKVINEGIDGADATWWAIDLGTQFNTGLYGLILGAALTNLGPSARFEGQLVTSRVEAPEAFGFDVPVRFNTVAYDLPAAFRFSVVENLAGGADALLLPGGDHSVTLALNLDDAVDTNLQAALGVEYSYRALVFVRGGKRWANEGDVIGNVRDFGHGLSVGGGLRIPLGDRRLMLDYAYTGMDELANIQIFSIEFGF